MLRVREGETILIVDREQPVARLEPIAASSAQGSPWQADLVRRGLVRPARGRLDAKAFQAMPLPTPQGGGDILDALLTEEGGRPMKYWDSSGIVPLLVHALRTADALQLAAALIASDRDAGRKEGFTMAVRA